MSNTTTLRPFKTAWRRTSRSAVVHGITYGESAEAVRAFLVKSLGAESDTARVLSVEEA